MGVTLEAAMFVCAVLLGLGVLASKASSLLGVPAMLLFMAVGMLAGSDGPGGIYFDNAAWAQSLGVVALAFILFAGGMDTEWEQVQGVVPPALALSTLGVAATALLTAAFVQFAFGLGWLEGLLLGSIVASTDAAAVFGVLRARSVRLNARLRALLELESGSNDPMAIFLTIGLVGVLSAGAASVGDLVMPFLVQMPVGALVGYAVGRGGVLGMRRLRLDFEALYHVLSIVIVLLSFSGAALAGGNGFLAVYVAGIAYGNGDFHQRKGLRRFHDGIAWLMQIAMFLTLGLLVFPHQLPGVAVQGVLIALFLMFVARPVAVGLTLLPFRFGARESVLVGWFGLRGAVPIVLGTYPLLAGLPRAQELFNVVFFVVLLSSLAQGTTLAWLARKLGLDS
jgi:cell volume regulation protein A